MERRTARYAKAQRTWFRADPNVMWLHRERGGGIDEMLARALELVAER
jgi:tRNA A37 N6-isopentenylltransferase MiaA